MSPQQKKRVKKAILDMATLALLILAFAAAARLVGSDRSLLPWLW